MAEILSTGEFEEDQLPEDDVNVSTLTFGGGASGSGAAQPTQSMAARRSSFVLCFLACFFFLWSDVSLCTISRKRAKFIWGRKYVVCRASS